MSRGYNDEYLIRLLAKHFFVLMAVYIFIYFVSFIAPRTIDLFRVILAIWGSIFIAHFLLTLGGLGALGNSAERWSQKLLREILI